MKRAKNKTSQVRMYLDLIDKAMEAQNFREVENLLRACSKKIQFLNSYVLELERKELKS